MRYSDLRKKHGVGTVPKETETDGKKTTKIKSSTGGNDYGSLLKKHGIGYNVDDNFVNAFIADANQFLVSAKDDYDGVGWRDATSSYEARHNARENLDSRYFTMKGWLYSNRSNLEESVYKDISNALNTYKTGADNILNAFRQKKEVADKYDTEEAYNAAVEAGKEYYATWGHYADAEDFGKYSSAGKELSYTDFGSTETHGSRGVRKRRYTTIDNYRAAAIALYEHNGGKADPKDTDKYSDQINIYRTMDDDEFQLLSYFIAKDKAEGTNLAEQYVDAMDNTLRNRLGCEIATELDNIDIPVLEDIAKLATGYAGGYINAYAGISQYVTGEKLPTDVYQYANYYISESLDGFARKAHQAATTIGNMTPSILVSYALTPAAGAATMGVSVAGNAYAQALDWGYDKTQARMYGTIVGALEGGLQYAIGGISKLSGVQGGKVLSKIAAIDNVALRISAKLGWENLKEIGEEELQNYLEPLVRTIVLGEDYDAPTAAELFETAVVTLLSTSAIEGPGTIVGDISNSRHYKNEYGDFQADLVDQALEGGDFANQLAQKYKGILDNGKDLSGHQLGRLVDANEQQYLAEDTAAIQSAAESRLSELGETGNVSELAAVLAKQAAGENLSHAEKRLIAKSKPGQQVASELDPANIRAGTTDSTWVQSIGTERINAAEYNSAFAEGKTQQMQANSTPADPSVSLRGAEGDVAISRGSVADLTIQQVLQQAIADMSNRPMDPKSYNALFSYKNQLQHVDTTEKLLNQKREILQQQKAAGEQTWQTEFDIKTLEKKLAIGQRKLQNALGDPALQQVVDKTATQMQRQQELAVENSRENILDFFRTYDRITEEDVNAERHSGNDATDTDSAYSKVEKVKCRNERLEGQKHPVTGVPFARKQIGVAGKQIEVVVPEFESYYEAQLPEEMYMMSDKKQFKESNRQLRDEIAKNPDLYAQFSKKQLSQIGRLETPDGYTWHHDAKTGTMQLVDRTIHEKTGHTGGRSLWGGGTGRR